MIDPTTDRRDGSCSARRPLALPASGRARPRTTRRSGWPSSAPGAGGRDLIRRSRPRSTGPRSSPSATTTRRTWSGAGPTPARRPGRFADLARDAPRGSPRPPWWSPRRSTATSRWPRGDRGRLRRLLREDDVLLDRPGPRAGRRSSQTQGASSRSASSGGRTRSTARPRRWSSRGCSARSRRSSASGTGTTTGGGPCPSRGPTPRWPALERRLNWRLYRESSRRPDVRAGQPPARRRQLAARRPPRAGHRHRRDRLLARRPRGLRQRLLRLRVRGRPRARPRRTVRVTYSSIRNNAYEGASELVLGTKGTLLLTQSKGLFYREAGGRRPRLGRSARGGSTATPRSSPRARR